MKNHYNVIILIYIYLYIYIIFIFWGGDVIYTLANVRPKVITSFYMIGNVTVALTTDTNERAHVRMDFTFVGFEI